MIEEIWRDIKGFEGIYQVSSSGLVKSLERVSIQKHLIKEKYIKGYDNGHGYWYVDLYIDGKRYKKAVHRLVGEAFIENYNNLPCINHKDENTLNNNYENLEWCTYKYNNTYGNHGLKQSLAKKGKRKGKDNPNSKMVVCLTTNKIFESVTQASEYYDIPNARSHIHRVCNGEFKYIGKLKDGTKLKWAWYNN